MIKAFIALGSNLQDPVNQVLTALPQLNAIPDIWVVAASSLYRTAPMDMSPQPDFINAVAEIKTALSPEDLLAALFTIEKKHQRVRLEKNGPRTLDLDILLYGNQMIETPTLTIPHPGMKNRSFVVFPLLEIAPTLILPCGTSIKSLWATFNMPELESLYKPSPNPLRKRERKKGKRKRRVL